jgi:hypothetical protein
MSLAYQSFSDPRAASWFLAEREEARLLGDGKLLVDASTKVTSRSGRMCACSPRSFSKSRSATT